MSSNFHSWPSQRQAVETIDPRHGDGSLRSGDNPPRLRRRSTFGGAGFSELWSPGELTAMAHYVDLHAHFLPALDDGARDSATALEMVSAVAALGFGLLRSAPAFAFRRPAGGRLCTHAAPGPIGEIVCGTTFQEKPYMYTNLAKDADFAYFNLTRRPIRA